MPIINTIAGRTVQRTIIRLVVDLALETTATVGVSLFNELLLLICQAGVQGDCETGGIIVDGEEGEEGALGLGTEGGDGDDVGDQLGCGEGDREGAGEGDGEGVVAGGFGGDYG